MKDEIERRIKELKNILAQKEDEAEAEFEKRQCYGGSMEIYLNLLAQIAGLDHEIEELQKFAEVTE